MYTFSILLFAITAVAADASLGMKGGSVDAAFHGVPSKATCASPIKLVIEANTVTLSQDDQIILQEAGPRGHQWMQVFSSLPVGPSA